jgi:hypothetical protein
MWVLPEGAALDLIDQAAMHRPGHTSMPQLQKLNLSFKL